MVGKARRHPLVTTGLIFAGVLVVAVSSSGTSVVTSPVFAATFGVLLLLFFWIQRRSAAQARRVVESITIEIDDYELKQSNSLVLTTIRREDVVELRYLPGGIMVVGRDLRHRILLNRELDPFDDLARRIEEWAPANSIRKTTQTPRSTLHTIRGDRRQSCPFLRCLIGGESQNCHSLLFSRGDFFGCLHGSGLDTQRRGIPFEMVHAVRYSRCVRSFA